MDWIKKNITPIIGTVTAGIILSLLGTLYAQQNKKIDAKADQQVLIQMVQNLKELRTIEQKRIEEERAEQKIMNIQMNQTLQNLNLQIILLNEKLKEEK